MDKLNKEPFNITILYGENNFRNVTSTLLSSIIQVYSIFCNLLQTYIPSSSTTLYNFLYNSFNKIAKGLELQMNLFIKDISGQGMNILIIIIVYSVIYILLYVIMYILNRVIFLFFMGLIYP